MYLQFIGTGDAFTYADTLGHNSAWFFTENTNIMIDMPYSNYERIREIDKTFKDVENIIITHNHADHTNGLEKFAYFRKFNPACSKVQKPKLYVEENVLHELWENNLKAGLMYSSDYTVKSLQDYFEVVIVKAYEYFYIDNMKFKLIPTKHMGYMDSFGILVEGLFYYSGDSTLDKELLKKISPNVQYIFHDCHMWDLEIASHASLEDIKSLPEEIKNKTILMHYHDGYDSDSFRKTVKNREKIEMAEPFKKYIFKDGD